MIVRINCLAAWPVQPPGSKIKTQMVDGFSVDGFVAPSKKHKKLPETNEGRPLSKGTTSIGNATEPTIDFQGICEFSRVFCKFKVFFSLIFFN